MSTGIVIVRVLQFALGIIVYLHLGWGGLLAIVPAAMLGGAAVIADQRRNA